MHAVFLGFLFTLPQLPVGTYLPVLLERGLRAEHTQAGEAVAARLSQRVPLPGGGFLPDAAEVVGTVVGCDGKTLTLTFNQLRLHGESEPIHVKLIAVADWLDVERTHDPLGAPDRSTSNPSQWTTMQIGRDEVYLANGVGRVYNQYSEPVGRADRDGVYAPPARPGSPERALGPFSTTASGLYNLPGLTLLSSGEPITFRLESRSWQLRAHDALLLEIVGP